MRLAPLVALTVAASSVAGCALTTGESGRGSDGIIAVRPGLYHARQELLELAAPAAPAGSEQQMARVFARGLTDGSTSCVTPGQVADRTGRAMLQSLTQGNCAVDALEVSGEHVTAELQCGGDWEMLGRVSLAGRMSAESSDVVLAVNREIDGAGPVRIKVRVTTRRIGDCSG